MFNFSNLKKKHSYKNWMYTQLISFAFLTNLMGNSHCHRIFGFGFFPNTHMDCAHSIYLFHLNNDQMIICLPCKLKSSQKKMFKEEKFISFRFKNMNNRLKIFEISSRIYLRYMLIKEKKQETLVHAPKLCAEEFSKRASLFPQTKRVFSILIGQCENNRRIPRRSFV